jgi:antirestriction protein ArdC
MSQQRIYQMITDRILARLEKGVVPWNKPWMDNTSMDIPVNLHSGRQYRGINVWMLLMMGYSSKYWLSFNQARKKGGQVKKGERSTPVIFWKILEVEDEDEPGGKKEVPMLRYFNAFNLDQIDGIEAPDKKEVQLNDFDPIMEAERIIHEMPNPPEITHVQPQAFYLPRQDLVNLPLPGLFDKPEYYYASAFHELVHSTGHEMRLSRRQSSETRHFGGKKYSREELVAEMGASFLCAHAGIENRTLDNQASYIKAWIDILKESPRILVQAGSQAQKAADYILGKHKIDSETTTA